MRHYLYTAFESLFVMKTGTRVCLGSSPLSIQLWLSQAVHMIQVALAVDP